MSTQTSCPTDQDESRDKTIFIWIDILGFSDRLESDHGYKDLKENLERFRSLFDSSNLFKSIIISDGVLIQLNNPKEIETAIEEVAEKQKSFILETKRFLRGGIAEGVILKKEDIEKNMIITDGLAKAVKLESKNVSWPLIATNEENLEKIRRLITAFPEQNFGLRKGFNEKGNIINFVDFTATINDSERENYFRLLNEMVNRYSNEPRIKSKYIWLLRHFYHTYGNTDYSGLCENLREVVL